MYLYFDRTGVLKEVINDKALRQGSFDANEIYIFVEDLDYSIPQNMWISYRLPDGSKIPEFEESFNAITEEDMQEIPYNSKRDLKFFKYYEKYPLYEIPLEKQLGQTVYSALSQYGTAKLTIQVGTGSNLTTLGMILFNVEESTAGSPEIHYDEYISLAQWNYLVNLLLGYGGGEFVTAEQVPQVQATSTIVGNALTNMNGRVLTAYTATYVDDPQYPYYSITKGGHSLSLEEAEDYMEFMCGSRYVPQYNYEKPKNTLFVFAKKSIWKPQWSALQGMRLYKVSNALVTTDNEGNINLRDYNSTYRSPLLQYAFGPYQQQGSWESRIGLNTSGTELYQVKYGSEDCMYRFDLRSLYGRYTTSGNDYGINLGTIDYPWGSLYVEAGSKIITGGFTSGGKGISIPDTSTWAADKTMATVEDIASAIETIRRNSFIDVDTTTYPTLADFLLSTGEEGHVYLYPVDTTDLTKGYHQYIWESNAWRFIGDTNLDLSNAVDLTSAQTISGTKIFIGGFVVKAGNVKEQFSPASGYTSATLGRSNNPWYDIFLSNSIDFGNGATITKDSSNRLNFNFNNNPVFKIGAQGGQTYVCSSISPDSANLGISLGRDTSRWLNGYFSGQVYAQNTFNIINASDIASNNELTADQIAIFTNGKPTIVSGSFMSYNNLIFFYGAESAASYYGWGVSTDGTFAWYINKSTNIITKYGNTQSRIVLNSISTINSKSLDYYQNNVFPYATTTTGTIRYDVVNNITVTANTTFTLTAEPSGTYPEYKAIISNTTSSSKTLTFTGVTKIVTNDSSISISGNVLELPGETDIEVNIFNGHMIAYNWDI